MKDYLEIPISDLKAVTYSNPDREKDELEWSFIEEIARQTGFYMLGINIKKAEKLKYSRKFDYFEFEFEGKNYILEKDKLKEDSN